MLTILGMSGKVFTDAGLASATAVVVGRIPVAHAHLEGLGQQKLPIHQIQGASQTEKGDLDPSVAEGAQRYLRSFRALDRLAPGPGTVQARSARRRTNPGATGINEEFTSIYIRFGVLAHGFPPNKFV